MISAGEPFIRGLMRFKPAVMVPLIGALDDLDQCSIEEAEGLTCWWAKGERGTVELDTASSFIE
jgi:hypothetical protein